MEHPPKIISKSSEGKLMMYFLGHVSHDRQSKAQDGLSVQNGHKCIALLTFVLYGTGFLL